MLGFWGSWDQSAHCLGSTISCMTAPWHWRPSPTWTLRGHSQALWTGQFQWKSLEWIPKWIVLLLCWLTQLFCHRIARLNGRYSIHLQREEQNLEKSSCVCLKVSFRIYRLCLSWKMTVEKSNCKRMFWANQFSRCIESSEPTATLQRKEENTKFTPLIIPHFHQYQFQGPRSFGKQYSC